MEANNSCGLIGAKRAFPRLCAGLAKRAPSSYQLSVGVSTVDKGGTTTTFFECCDAQGQDITTTIELGYIEVPLRVWIPLLTKSQTLTSLGVGTALGFNTHCEMTVRPANTVKATDCLAEPSGVRTIRLQPDYLDWSVAAGIKVDHRMNDRVHTGLEVLFTQGLNDIEERWWPLGKKNRAITAKALFGVEVF